MMKKGQESKRSCKWRMLVSILFGVWILLAGLLLTACQNIVAHTVTFLDDDGVVLSIEEIEDGAVIQQIPEVTAEDGYNVIWITERGAEFNFDDPITRDWTLHASFVPKEYRVDIEAVNAVVRLTDENGTELTGSVKHDERIILSVMPDMHSGNLSLTINEEKQTIGADGTAEIHWTVKGDLTIEATAEHIYYPLTIATGENLSVTVSDADGVVYDDSDEILKGSELTIAVKPNENYILDAFSVRMGTENVSVNENVCVIDALTDALTITAEAKLSRTLTGQVDVNGDTEKFDVTKFSASVGFETMDISVNDGVYTIRGLEAGNLDIIFNYEGYYPVIGQFTPEDGSIISFDIVFQNRMLEYAKNMNGDSSGSGDVTSQDFSLGWAHVVNFKNVSISSDDEADFLIETTITSLDSDEIWPGPVINTYNNEGELVRNLLFAYLIRNRSADGPLVSGAGMFGNVLNLFPYGGSAIEDKAVLIAPRFDLGYKRPAGTADTYWREALIRYNGEYYFCIGLAKNETFDVIVKFSSEDLLFTQDEVTLGFGVGQNGANGARFTDCKLYLGDAATKYMESVLQDSPELVVKKTLTVQMQDTTAGTITSDSVFSVWQGQNAVTVTWTTEEDYEVDCVKLNGTLIEDWTPGSVSILLEADDPDNNELIIYTKAVAAHGTLAITFTAAGEPIDSMEDLVVSVDGIKQTGTVEKNVVTLSNIAAGDRLLDMTYPGFYAESLSVNVVPDISNEISVDFNNQILIRVRNMQGNVAGTAGTQYDSPKIVLDWSHIAEFQNGTIQMSDPGDFMIYTTVTDHDVNTTWGGISLNLYREDGTLTRNILFGYNLQNYDGIVSGQGMFSSVVTVRPDGASAPKRAYVAPRMNLGYVQPQEGDPSTYIHVVLVRYNQEYYFLIGQNNEGTYDAMVKFSADELEFQPEEVLMRFGIGSGGGKGTLDDSGYAVGKVATEFIQDKINDPSIEVVEKKQLTASMDNAESGTITSATSFWVWQGQTDIVISWALEEGYTLERIVLNGSEIELPEGNSVTIQLDSTYANVNTLVIYTWNNL